MIDWPRIRVLSFDCYGTLIDWEQGLLAVLLPWSERAGLLTPGASAEVRGAHAERLLSAFASAESARENEGFREYPDVLRLVMGDLGRAFGAPVTESDRERLAASVGEWPAFADTRGALAALGLRFRLVVASNVDHGSFAQTRRRLASEFDAVVTAEDVRAYKPAPAHFDEVERRISAWGLPRDAWVHVAQSLYHDIAPASARGVRTVWVDRRAGKSGGATSAPPPGVSPDMRVTDLRTLVQLAGA